MYGGFQYFQSTEGWNIFKQVFNVVSFAMLSKYRRVGFKQVFNIWGFSMWCKYRRVKFRQSIQRFNDLDVFQVQRG